MKLSRRQLPMIGAGLAVTGDAQAQRAREPQRPVRFILPAGTGGGADQMARIIQGIITRHILMVRAIGAHTVNGAEFDVVPGDRKEENFRQALLIGEASLAVFFSNRLAGLTLMFYPAISKPMAGFRPRPA